MIIRSSSICLFLLVKFIAGGKIKTNDCTHVLNSHKEKNSKPYQVVLLSNQDTYSILNKVIATVLQNLPYLQIDVQKMSSEDLKQSMRSPSFYTLRKTSLFLLVNTFDNSPNLTNILSPLKYLTNLSPGKDRPKVLQIFTTNGKSSFKLFLHKMWLSHFLDFTVFEIRNVQQKLYSRKLESFKTLVHHYNPFTNKYFKKMCSLTTIWFPNKLLNLHGNQIKGELYFIPPFSLATYNKVGHLQSCSGADVDMFNSLSEAMNFSTYIESDVNSTIGTFHGNEATGMLELLINNKKNIVITSTINFRPSTEGCLYGFSTNFDVVSIVAFVPISHKNVDEQFLNFKVLWFRILLYIGFVIVMWTVIVNIDNEENSWKPEYIAAIILGVTIPKQPNPIQHRIVFLYFIAIGFYCSISFLGGLTASKVKISDEVQLETFQDLAKSNLRLYIYTNIDKYLNDDSEDLQILRKKVVPTPYVDTECIAMLIKYRNVSCLIFDSYARLLVEIFKDESGHPITKILKPIIFNTRRVIV